MKIKFILLILIQIVSFSCQSQTNNSMTSKTTNPLLCNPEKGICEIPGLENNENSDNIVSDIKPIKVTYFTDPICSSCWGIEPQLRKLKLEYGDYVEIDYRMGGLLPDWSYNSGGISKPADVAHHWVEASMYYQMPISGDVWLNDPLASSYPPSIALKAAQMQSKEKAIDFMRHLRESLFLDNQNITRWEVIQKSAEYANLDITKLEQDVKNNAQKAFEEDLILCRKMGVRGFPTLFFSDEKGNQITIYGSRPYAEFEKAIQKLTPNTNKKQIDKSSTYSLFNHYPTLTPKEYAIISDISFSEAVSILDTLTSEGKLTKQTIKTGSIYKIK